MKKSIKKPQAKETKPKRTMGIDIGDRWCHYCWLNEDGEAVETGKIRTREKDLREFFEGEKRMRIAMECGYSSASLAERSGHRPPSSGCPSLRARSSACQPPPSARKRFTTATSWSRRVWARPISAGKSCCWDSSTSK